MKKTVTELLSKPKLLIPAFAVLVIVGSAIAYGHIGNPPVVPSNIQIETPESNLASGSNIALSFAKTGRVESVSVKKGDLVKAGQVLARLSAPDAQGAVSQAKGALDLAEAQYASLNVEYANTKKQQDLIVENAYKTLVSSGLEGVPSEQDPNVPIISGTYSCDKEGSYILKPYSSGNSDSGFSMNYEGLETGVASVAYDNPVPLGSCGLQVKFTHATNFTSAATWTIAIPNTKSDVYLENKNAYDFAVNNREKVLADLTSRIGENASGSSVAKAQVDAARGAYEAALGAYQNNVITSPVDGSVTFIDSNLKAGQSIESGKSVISISVK